MASTMRISRGLMRGLPLLVAALAGCDAIHRVSAGGDKERVVEVAMFDGGYGITWHQKMAEKYTAEHAAEGVRVRLWGDQRVAEIVKPRILRRDPPDVILITNIPMWLLIRAGKAYPFDSALDSPAIGADKTWRDTFIPGALDTYASGGKVYALPGGFAAWSCWYDARMFRAHGWTAPKTWSQFNALCEQIKAAGIAPIAYQGKYPYYAWFTFISLVQRCGGLSAINRINQIEAGAFSHPDVVHAAHLMQDMALKYFQRGAMAMSHTESQLEFVGGHAAMIFCGVWLENEMRKSTPPGFEMRGFNVPAVEGGKGNPGMFNGQGAEFLFIPSDARNPELALDFCRYLISPLNGPDMVATIGSISPIKGAAHRETLSPALQSAMDMVDNAPGIFSERLGLLFVEWTEQVLNPSMSQMLRGDITPETFCKRLDDGLTPLREHPDPDKPIPDYTPYNPAQFGETP